MKFLYILTLSLLTLVAYTFAQVCLPNPSCSGDRNAGRRGAGCRAITMWYYDTRTRQCRRMRYLGCGGNNNRWCNRFVCAQRCRR